MGYDTADDAGVYKIDEERALVQTVDFFTPIVDDPHLYGCIAAANALSDVYAMGGTPITAMAITCFPEKGLDLQVLADIMKGGAEKLHEAGVALLGGHSVADPEIKFGYSVTGLIHPGRILTNAGARPGDVRGDHDVRQSPERVIGRQRLLVEVAEEPLHLPRPETQIIARELQQGTGHTQSRQVERRRHTPRGNDRQRRRRIVEEPLEGGLRLRVLERMQIVDDEQQVVTGPAFECSGGVGDGRPPLRRRTQGRREGGLEVARQRSFVVIPALGAIPRDWPRRTRPKPCLATLAVVPYQSCALRLKTGLLVPLVKFNTSVPRPPPLADDASTASVLSGCGVARTRVPVAGKVFPSIKAFVPPYGPNSNVEPSTWLRTMRSVGKP